MLWRLLRVIGAAGGSEIAAVTTVVLILAGLPGALWHWKNTATASHPNDNTRVITLTAVAHGGIWTTDDVVGHNYWRRQPKRVDEIALTQGDHVVVRLRSADVLHSFAIPLLRIGPVEVPAGHTVQVEFDADRPGRLTFLCWQVCSPDHSKLRGHFLVRASGVPEGDGGRSGITPARRPS